MRILTEEEATVATRLGVGDRATHSSTPAAATTTRVAPAATMSWVENKPVGGLIADTQRVDQKLHGTLSMKKTTTGLA